MKIDLTQIDRDEFVVRPHLIAGEICYIVFPKSIATKYTKQTLIYRSSVWNAQGEPVSLSFKKFFNWGEQPDLAYTPFSMTANGGVELMEKIDGSALIVSKYKGQLIVRTRGTVDASDMENGFEIETLKAKYPLAFQWPDGVETGLYTRIFEWVSPYNRIVLDYGLEPDIYLIGAIKHEDYSLVSQKELDEWAMQMYVKRPKRFNFATIQEMLEGVAALKGEEGLCCYCNKGQDIRKVKSAWYLALHKMKSELGSFEHLVDLYFAMGTPTYEEFAEHIKQNFDYEIGESIRGDISRIAGGMKEVRELMKAMEQKVNTLRAMSRKDAAAIILQAYGNTNRSGMAFKRLDNKELVQDDIKKLLYQVLKK